VGINDFLSITKLFWQGLAKEVLAEKGVFAVVTGMPSFYLNPVLELDDIKQLPKLEAFFKKQRVAWSLYLESDGVDPTLLWDLQSQGFSIKESAYAMSAELNNLAFKLPENFKFERVTSEETWADWVSVIQSGFESDDASSKLFLALNRGLVGRRDVEYDCFVLYDKDKPIAVCSITLDKVHCRLDNIATKKSDQHHGYGSVVTEATMQQAKSKGCEICFLESTENTIEFYKKIGFHYLSKIDIFSKDS
jgi:ribosomal protein S18 acetylase RimI-like enzyme